MLEICESPRLSRVATCREIRRHLFACLLLKLGYAYPRSRNLVGFFLDAPLPLLLFRRNLIGFFLSPRFSVSWRFQWSRSRRFTATCDNDAAQRYKQPSMVDMHKGISDSGVTVTRRILQHYFSWPSPEQCANSGLN